MPSFGPATAAQPPAPGRSTPDAPTHACVRCGRPVSLDVALCEECNPLGLAQPAATQLHGIALGGVAVAVVLLAVLGKVAVAGVGPFRGEIAAIAAAGDGLAVTLTVQNQGSSSGATTCRVTDPSARYGGPSAYLLSPSIGAGATITFERTVPQFGTSPKPLTVECTGP